MLNLYHILIDGLFDSVPVVLAFMALALGSGGTDVGLVVSLGAALSTAVGLGTGLFSRRFGFYGSVALLIGLAGLGYLGAAFAGGMVAAGRALCWQWRALPPFITFLFPTSRPTQKGSVLGGS